MELTTSCYKDLGDLHALLLKACPPDDKGKQSIPVLAQALGVSHQYIYKWIDAKKVPPAYASKMVDKANGRVALTDFHPYVFG